MVPSMFEVAALRWIASVAVGLPALWALVLGALMFLAAAPSERTIARITATTFVTALSASIALAWSTSMADAPQVISLGHLFSVGEYDFALHFVLDRLSASMLLLTSAICGLVARFSVSYLHREPGFARFFSLLSLFAAAMMFLVLSGGLDQMFLGWELVGFTSWLLIAFFWQRSGPVRHGLRAFVTYRACDAGLLLGAALLHHFAHGADIAGATHYPIITGHVETWQATLVALCLLLAAMGKSAQAPFSDFLPRAMEGPTPSSALFYGALSVHAGSYLLLRAQPLLDHAPLAAAATVAVGLITAISATFSARVQSDIKSNLAYAVITQTGLIFVEIGLGLYTLALWHMVAHAILRTLQLLRAPSALAAAFEIRALARGHQFVTGRHYRRLMPAAVERLLYRAALERFYFDVILYRVVVTPVLRLADAVERLDQRMCEIAQTDAPDATATGVNDTVVASTEPSSRTS